MTVVPKAAIRAANSWPIRPRPTTPTVLSAISTPVNWLRFHSPARSDASAAGIIRATDSSSASACSAAVMMFDCGALTTSTPRAVAAGTSTLSRPMPGPGDHLERRRGGQRLGVDGGRGPDQDGVGIGQRRQQRGAVGAVDVPDLEFRPEHVHRGLGELLGDQHDGLGHSRSSPLHIWAGPGTRPEPSGAGSKNNPPTVRKDRWDGNARRTMLTVLDRVNDTSGEAPGPPSRYSRQVKPGSSVPAVSSRCSVKSYRPTVNPRLDRALRITAGVLGLVVAVPVTLAVFFLMVLAWVGNETGLWILVPPLAIRRRRPDDLRRPVPPAGAGDIRISLAILGALELVVVIFLLGRVPPDHRRHDHRRGDRAGQRLELPTAALRAYATRISQPSPWSPAPRKPAPFSITVRKPRERNTQRQACYWSAVQPERSARSKSQGYCCGGSGSPALLIRACPGIPALRPGRRRRLWPWRALVACECTFRAD